MMVPWKILALGMACFPAACAAPKACPKPEIEIQTSQQPSPVQYITVRPKDPPAHALLIETYEDTLSQEKAVAIHAKNAGIILHLLPYDTAARNAMVPILDPQHVASDLEVKRAIIAEGALAAYLNSVKEPK